MLDETTNVEALPDSSDDGPPPPLALPRPAMRTASRRSV